MQGFFVLFCFLPVAALSEWELSVKVVQLALRDPGGAKCAGTRSASAAGVMALSESFFWASCSWQSEGLFGQSFSIAPPIQAFRRLPCLGSFSVVWCIRHRGAPLAGVLLCRLVCQALKGAPGWGLILYSNVSGLWWASHSIVHLLTVACGKREAMVMAPPPPCDSAVSTCFHGCQAFLHRHFPPNLLPHIPLSISPQSTAALTLGVFPNT